MRYIVCYFDFKIYVNVTTNELNYKSFGTRKEAKSFLDEKLKQNVYAKLYVLESLYHTED